MSPHCLEPIGLSKCREMQSVVRIEKELKIDNLVANYLVGNRPVF